MVDNAEMEDIPADRVVEDCGVQSNNVVGGRGFIGKLFERRGEV